MALLLIRDGALFEMLDRRCPYREPEITDREMAASHGRSDYY